MIIKVSVLDRNIFSRWHPKIKDYLIKNSNFKGYISLDYKFRVRTNVTGMIPLNINNKFIFKYQDTFQQNNLDLRNKIIKIIKNYLINVDEISCIGGESYIYMIINSIKGNYYCNQEKLKQEADFNLKTNQNFLIDYNKIIKLKLNNSLILNLSKLNTNLLNIINQNQKVKLIIIINCHHQDFWKKIKHLSNFKLNKRIYLTDFNYFITVNIFYQKKII